jgi:Protein of unknown function (DUF3738)
MVAGPRIGGFTARQYETGISYLTSLLFGELYASPAISLAAGLGQRNSIKSFCNPIFCRLSAKDLIKSTCASLPAGGRMTIDTTSVKFNASSPRQPGVPPATNVTGALFSVESSTLDFYIRFAYKIADDQLESLLSQLPKWVTEDRFDIQGQALGNVTLDSRRLDQIRLMLQSLLADHFKLAVHYENRWVTQGSVRVDAETGWQAVKWSSTFGAA